MGEKNAFRLLVMKLEGKSLLGKLTHVWNDDIKMDFKELVWDDMDWVGRYGMGSSGSERRKVVGLCEKVVLDLWLPYNAGNFVTSSVDVEHPGKVVRGCLFKSDSVEEYS
jgi:hypothetical protein